MRMFGILFVVSCFAALTLGVEPDKKTLPIGLHPAEIEAYEAGFRAQPPLSAAPVGPVRSLGEWEDADAAMTLWPNPSLVRALSARGAVKLFADSNSEKNWWLNWLGENQIPKDRISFFVVPSDSIWIRDYGPWPILDGNGQFGFVHGKYNRPRPYDDLVADYLSKTLNIPLYKPGLVQTGGNYYSDALGNAFSSTLVYTENQHVDAATVKQRMKNFLGIERYTTSPLAPGLTIEHLDTFGKLVSPDTWVFSEFPPGAGTYRQDSERMVALLKTLKSPYGTPYRIFRLRMVRSGGDYRAYLNSFISNGTLYFAAYGDAVDEEVKKVYQAALPGYEVVGVDAMDTTWGDSVHCRNRNLIKAKNLFLFPSITQKKHGLDTTIAVEVEVISTTGATLENSPIIHWSKGEIAMPPLSTSLLHGRTYSANLPPLARGTVVNLHVEAKDSLGVVKRAPIRAPIHRIEVKVE